MQSCVGSKHSSCPPSLDRFRFDHNFVGIRSLVNPCPAHTSKAHANNLRSSSTFCLVVVSQPRVQPGSHRAQQVVGGVAPSLLLSARRKRLPLSPVGTHLNSVGLLGSRRWGWVPSLAATGFRFLPGRCQTHSRSPATNRYRHHGRRARLSRAADMFFDGH